MSDDVELNLKPLEGLLKALTGKQPSAKVGVLGSNAVRGSGTSANAPSNATIGARHELGLGVPERSFLRVPITENLDKQLEKSGSLDPDLVIQIIKQGSFLPWLKRIAVIAEGIVAEGFATGGYGKWAPWRPGYTNNTGMILVDTTQLRNSITSEVEE